MTKKYVSSRSASKVDCYHENQECPQLPDPGRRVEDNEIEFHDLRACYYCARDDTERHTDQDWSYQKLRGALE